jgi:hypothetical protein
LFAEKLRNEGIARKMNKTTLRKTNVGAALQRSLTPTWANKARNLKKM